MPDDRSLGDRSQTRIIAEQVAEAAATAAITQFRAQYPPIERPVKAEVPAPLKWASAIIAAIMILGVGALGTWLVSTTSQTQLALGRIEERVRFIGEDMDRRVERLERLQEQEDAK